MQVGGRSGGASVRAWLSQVREMRGGGSPERGGDVREGRGARGPIVEREEAAASAGQGERQGEGQHARAPLAAAARPVLSLTGMGGSRASIEDISPPRQQPHAKPYSPPSHPLAGIAPNPDNHPRATPDLALRLSSSSYRPSSASSRPGASAVARASDVWLSGGGLGNLSPSKHVHLAASWSASRPRQLPHESERFDQGSVHRPVTAPVFDSHLANKFNLLRPSPGFIVATKGPPFKKSRASMPPREASASPSARRSLALASKSAAVAWHKEERQGGEAEGVRGLDQLASRLSQAMSPPSAAPPSVKTAKEAKGANAAKLSSEEAHAALASILGALRAKCGSASASFALLCSAGPRQKHATGAQSVSLDHLLPAVEALGLGMPRSEVAAAFALIAEHRSNTVSLSGLQSHFFKGTGASATASQPCPASAQQTRLEIDKLAAYARQVPHPKPWTPAAWYTL